jgi:hypothetical protein
MNIFCIEFDPEDGSELFDEAECEDSEEEYDEY